MNSKLDTALTVFAVAFGLFLIVGINSYAYQDEIVTFAKTAGHTVAIYLNLTESNDKQLAKSNITDDKVLGIQSKSSNNKTEPITLDKIFDGIDNTANSKNVITIMATGDVMLGRSVNYMTLKNKDFEWPYKNMKTFLNNADLTFINLETPITEKCKVTNEGMMFCADKNHAKELSNQGIDLVSLANNHTLNHGRSGLNQTIQYLTDSNIGYTGVQNIYYKTINNTKFAFLGYDGIECYEPLSCIDKSKIKKDIQTAKNNSDVVIIMYHWGTEYTHNPTSQQIDIAHYSIDNGADLILGNHPHWYQPVEIYKNKLIMYSHGNLIFDQMWSEKTKEGIVGKYKFMNNQLADVEFIPIYIENYGQPKIPPKTKYNNIIRNLEKISYNFKDEKTR